jgi:hypothetical protein
MRAESRANRGVPENVIPRSEASGGRLVWVESTSLALPGMTPSEKAANRVDAGAEAGAGAETQPAANATISSVAFTSPPGALSA